MLCRRHFQGFLKTYFGFTQGSFSSLTFSYSSSKILWSSFFFLSTLSTVKLLSCSLYQHPHQHCHLPGEGQLLSVLPQLWAEQEEELESVFHGGCLVASLRKFRGAIHGRALFKLSVQVGGDALPHESLHLLSLSLHPAPFLAGVYQRHSWRNVPCSAGPHRRMVGEACRALWVPLGLPKWRLRADVAKVTQLVGTFLGCA